MRVNMMSNIFAALVVLALTAACANVQFPKTEISTKIETFTEPPVGVKSTASIGDTLISQGIKVETPGIRLTAAYRTEWVRNSGHRAFPFFFEAATVLKKIGSMNGVPLYVGPSVGGVMAADGTQLGAPYGIAVTDGGEVKFVYAMGGVIEETPGRNAAFEKTTLVGENEKNFRQDFLYNGRNKEELFFSYREFKSDLARPAFQQDVRYLIADSKNIGFKSLRLRVLEATNQDITYIIEKPFD